MKVSDYVAQRLSLLGIRRCFSVTGGGAMHLNDSFGEANGIACTYLHHEQACAIAAEGYARITGKPAVVNVTSGPGAINALNGVFGAFTDSIPMIIVSGQVKTETLLERVGTLPLRQLGDQEARSEAYIPAFVKSFQSLRTAEECIAAIDRAIRLTSSGRPGPCWIEIPVDIQGSRSALLKDNLQQPLLHTAPQDHVSTVSEKDLADFTHLLRQSKRPLLLLGTGVRLSGAQKEVLQFAESLQLPIVTAWTHDIIDNNHELFIGRPGTIGTRPGNFAVQTCDLLIVLGSRLNIRQVSYNWAAFASHASVVMVDIDEAELKKPYLDITLSIQADIRHFITAAQAYLATSSPNIASEQSLGQRRQWVSRLRTVALDHAATAADYRQPPLGSGINPYHFIFALARHLKGHERIICGDATACIVPFQILPLRDKQRMFSNSGCASMGYDLPAGIGAALAAQDTGERGSTVVLAGDGSLMMNIQELQTLAASNLDLLLFILDNNGYLSIKQTQSNFFGREHGASPASGVTFPDFARVAEAFGLPVTLLNDYGEIENTLTNILHETSGPRVCVVKLYEEQEFEPRLKSKIVDGVIHTPELDDMFPHLPIEKLDSIRAYLLR
ncbi:thiamine pyrophosphate-binding protein [Synechococcus sp. HK05]|uniref:thiamine pyrophosphate-binding protein n=1 Tax=Synechococcus sp. HK05 TaxID=2725975 RepID=UPI001C3857BB|nr:thiamine pyrophosphate-binding protein [Synechococcus sp. HK05]MBV2352093.1 thiamine pyrophosphate-binding protein [Synechococcus sp. HK05]